MTNTAAHTLHIIDHSDNTEADEIFASLAAANASLQEFAEEENLMSCEGKQGMVVLLDEAGRHSHSAYITA